MLSFNHPSGFIPHLPMLSSSCPQEIKDFIYSVRRIYNNILHKFSNGVAIEFVLDHMSGGVKREAVSILSRKPGISVLDLMDILQKNFVQLPSVVFLYKQFFARKQDPEESISSFANDLESLRLDIEQYHSTVFEDILIRDHFIYNLHDVNLKLELVRYIREKSSSTFEDVYNEARTTIALLKETLLALVRDLFTFSSKVIKRFIIV
jgi:hypothetical protein